MPETFLGHGNIWVNKITTAVDGYRKGSCRHQASREVREMLGPSRLNKLLTLGLLQVFDLCQLGLILSITHLSLERVNIQHFAKIYLSKKPSFPITPDRNGALRNTLQEFLFQVTMCWNIQEYVKNGNRQLLFPISKHPQKLTDWAGLLQSSFLGQLPSLVNSGVETNWVLVRK